MILMVCFTLSSLAGENKTYKWMDGKDVVGKLSITSDVEDDRTTYNFDSEITVNVGEEVKIRDVIKNEFKNDSLLEANVARYFNDKSRIAIKENMDGTTHSRTINGTEKKLDRAIEVFTYLQLFVEAPKDVVGVYYEIYGKMFKVQADGENAYVLIGPNNRKERFVYNEKGQLVSAEIETNFGTFKLVK